MTTYSEAELAALTPEEQEALLADEQPEAIAEHVADAVADEAPAGEDVVAEGAPAADADAPEPVVDGEFRPEFKTAVPEDLADRIAELDRRENEIEESFENGDIERSEYRRQLRAVADEKLGLTIAAKQAEWAAAQNVEIENQLRLRETKRFFSKDANKLYSEDDILYSVLDATVRKLQADPETKDNGYAWHLETADRMVRQRLAKTGAPVAAVRPEAPERQPTVRTISGLPAAAPAPVGDDMMGKISTLEGEDLEKYVGRLSAGDVEKLLRSA